jgi:hypothetical protein
VRRPQALSGHPGRKPEPLRVGVAVKRCGHAPPAGHRLPALAVSRAPRSQRRTGEGDSSALGAAIRVPARGSCPSGVGCVKAFMQLVGTHVEDRQVGRVDGSCFADLRQRRSAWQANLAPAVPAPGADDAGCRVGPGRGARLSTSPFPRTALRTRRAGHPGTGLSTRPVTNNGCVGARLRSTRPGLPGRDAGIHRRLLPCRPATTASLCPFAMCTPLACSDYYGHSATTRHQ